MFQKLPLLSTVIVLGGLLVVVNMLMIHLGKVYKNSFYEYVVVPLVVRYEKGRRVNTEVLTDHLESIFQAARRHNAIAEQVLQSLIERR